MSNRIKQLIKSFNSLQNLDNIKIELIDDCIEKWFVKLLYDNNREIHLQFEHHLVQFLPPKVTVIFPSSLQCVCVQELGSVNWSSNTDMYILIYGIYNHYNKSAKVYTKDILSNKEANEYWQFIKKRHDNWKMIDISQDLAQMPQTEIEYLRSEARELLTHSVNFVNYDENFMLAINGQNLFS
jgi:hypothetical protein